MLWLITIITYSWVFSNFTLYGALRESNRYWNDINRNRLFRLILIVLFPMFYLYIIVLIPIMYISDRVAKDAYNLIRYFYGDWSKEGDREI